MVTLTVQGSFDTEYMQSLRTRHGVGYYLVMQGFIHSNKCMALERKIWWCPCLENALMQETVV